MKEQLCDSDSYLDSERGDDLLEADEKKCNDIGLMRQFFCDYNNIFGILFEMLTETNAKEQSDELVSLAEELH